MSHIKLHGVGNMEVTAEFSLNCCSLVMGLEARMDHEVSAWELTALLRNLAVNGVGDW